MKIVMNWFIWVEGLGILKSNIVERKKKLKKTNKQNSQTNLKRYYFPCRSQFGVEVVDTK